VPVRKPGKLPAARMSVEFSLEYGDAQLDIHDDALRPGQRVVVIDDLIATGGTAEATGRLVRMLKAEIAGFAFLIELADLGGRSRLAGQEVFSLLRYE
jgi:adenine phosphoribosyltransferase